ncbi:iron-containing alcohol dehydrogenase [Nocardia sp. NPDC050713]|uniref:iron-containing alcohol dehydrogenase n=1 Tax=Nocardia sp. NPDC050713 TaxID=3154511 RepID=UPI0033DE0B7B
MTVPVNDRARSERFYFPYEGEDAAQRFFFPNGCDEVLFRATAARDVPRLVEKFGYQRPFVFTSRTLNRTTDVVDEIVEGLGGSVVNVSDRVGEHAPITNVLAAIDEVRDAGADVLICIGGGSVMDFGKFVQLGVTQGVRTREGFRALRVDQSPVLDDNPQLRQITIPTTFSLSEWTPAGTPVDDETDKKITLRIPRGVGRAIVFDPAIVRHTPKGLALKTAIRGLDHSINNVMTTAPNDIVTVLALQAVQQFHKGIRALARDDLDTAMPTLQKASWLGGVCQMSVPHGFSHFMVHVIAPWAHIGHSETACVMMLAQARWWRGHSDPRLGQVAAAMGRPDDPIDEILFDLLRECEMPTTLADLGLDAAQVEDVIPHTLAHPYVTLHNVVPITTADDIRRALATVSG